MSSTVNKPTLIFNEFGKPTLDVKEVNLYMNQTIVSALRSVSTEDLANYKKLVADQKNQESSVKLRDEHQSR